MARNGIPDVIERSITLSGFTPLMFDRYAGDNKTSLPVEAKMYFLPDGKTLCLPAANLSSFLSAQNTNSVAKLIGGRGYGRLAQAMLSFVIIEPNAIPITRNGEPVQFYGFVDDVDEKGGIHVERHVARLKNGIPNPKERPVVDLPWEVSFKLTLFKNDEFDETLLKDAFRRGGIALGIGTFRGVYGKFTVSQWE